MKMGLWQKAAAAVAAVAVCAAAVMIMSRPVNGAAQSDPRRPVLATLTIEGQRQGTIADQTSPIRPVAYSHGIVSPRDAASGLATGRRQHKPLVIVKELDKASPLLMKAMVTDENLKSVVLTYTIGPTTYRVRLTNASIADIQQDSQSTLVPRETISFTYQKIEWTYMSTDGTNITAMDDWEAPVN
jgi:type VI secretion system secreted protein Hcp